MTVRSGLTSKPDEFRTIPIEEALGTLILVIEAIIVKVEIVAISISLNQLQLIVAPAPVRILFLNL
jgi:hypothetical protein